MAYDLKETEEFGKKFNKIPKDIRYRFEKQFKQVTNFVGISNKKSQQNVINNIRTNLHFFNDFVENNINSENNK